MSDDTNSSSGFGRGFIIAAIVVVLVVLAGVIVLVSSIVGKPKADPSPRPSQSVDSAAASVCGLPGYDTKNTLTQAPTDAKWALVGDTASPASKKAGPGRTSSDGLKTCFAHTAEGALFAAINFIAAPSDGNLRPHLADLLADGSGKTITEHSSPGQPSSARAQVAGFAIDKYDGAHATVDVALLYSTSDGALVSAPVELVWEHGDWKVVVTDQGTLPLAPAPLQSLGGYIPWSGA